MNFNKVMVVDDSPTELHMVVDILKRHDVSNIVTASNGAEAITMAKNEKPDVILMDVVMPEMNGFMATRKIKKDPDTAGIPVIIISSKDQDTDKVWGKRQGADEYLTKPVQENELVKVLESL
jgi:twitching motility two-component system response regulator PilH